MRLSFLPVMMICVVKKVAKKQMTLVMRALMLNTQHLMAYLSGHSSQASSADVVEIFGVYNEVGTNERVSLAVRFLGFHRVFFGWHAIALQRLGSAGHKQKWSPTFFVETK